MWRSPNTAGAAEERHNKIEAVGTGVKVTVEQELANGTMTRFQYTSNNDGKDTPTTGNPDADMVARSRINATTTQTVNKKGGKITTTATAVVSLTARHEP